MGLYVFRGNLASRKIHAYLLTLDIFIQRDCQTLLSEGKSKQGKTDGILQVMKIFSHCSSILLSLVCCSITRGPCSILISTYLWQASCPRFCFFSLSTILWPFAKRGHMCVRDLSNCFIFSTVLWSFPNIMQNSLKPAQRRKKTGE